MGRGQGLGGCSWADTDSMAVERYSSSLHKRLPDKSRLFECALSAYAASTGWADSAWKVKHLLSFFEELDRGTSGTHRRMRTGRTARTRIRSREWICCNRFWRTGRGSSGVLETTNWCLQTLWSEQRTRIFLSDDFGRLAQTKEYKIVCHWLCQCFAGFDEETVQ